MTMYRVRLLLLTLTTLLLPQFAWSFDMSKTLDVGSWQEREEITYNAKGKKTNIATIWVGIVDKEDIAGVPHVWMEMRTQTYRENRKGERKPKGEQAIMKTSIETSALTDFDDPFNNMRKFAKDTIIKNGNAKPMRMRAGGVMADMILKAFGASVDFTLEPSGKTESINTPAGDFHADQYLGTGSVEMQVLIRRVRVDSEIDMWLSEDVPMGVVKQHITNTQGKKVTRIETQLLAHGTDATSLIDNAEAQDMPGLNIFNPQ